MCVHNMTSRNHEEIDILEWCVYMIRISISHFNFSVSLSIIVHVFLQ